MTPPTVVISLDFELAWGSMDCPAHRRAYNLKVARWTHDIAAPLILEELKKRSLTATWATVGALMQNGITKKDTDLPAIHTPNFHMDWFERVPCQRGEHDAPEWFAPRIVDDLQEAGQEIGFHGWSHAAFLPEIMPKERAQEELAKCRTAATERGIEGTSFVYPRNQIGHLDLLPTHGFQAYRGLDVLRFNSVRRPLRGLEMILSDSLGLRPATAKAALDGNLVNIPGTLMLRHHGGSRKFITDAARKRRLRRGLTSLRHSSEVMHVWLHPINLYEAHPRLASVLSGFLDLLAEARARHQVRIQTMGEIAKWALSEDGRHE